MAEVGGIWMPQKSGTWLCFLKLPRGSTPEDRGRGERRNGPGKQQQVLGALETLRQLAACPGEEKAKERSGRSQVGKSFLGSTRKAGRPQSREGRAGSTPPEAKFQSREGIKAMGGANTVRMPGRWSPRAPFEIVYPLAAAFDAAPQPHYFPPNHERNRQPGNTPCPSILFPLAILFLSEIFSRSK